MKDLSQDQHVRWRSWPHAFFAWQLWMGKSVVQLYCYFSPFLCHWHTPVSMAFRKREGRRCRDWWAPVLSPVMVLWRSSFPLIYRCFPQQDLRQKTSPHFFVVNQWHGKKEAEGKIDHWMTLLKDNFPLSVWLLFSSTLISLWENCMQQAFLRNLISVEKKATKNMGVWDKTVPMRTPFHIIAIIWL